MSQYYALTRFLKHRSSRFLFFYLVSFAVLNVILFLSAGKVYSGQATLSWNAPTTNADGTPLTDLGGYYVYYGISSGNYTVKIQKPLGDKSLSCQDVNNDGITECTSSVVVPDVEVSKPVTYYFVVTAYDTSGNESGYSNEVSKLISSTANPVNGVCGTSNSGTFTTAPTTNLCSAGTATGVSGSGPWRWSCTGFNGGSTANCSANIQTRTVSASAGSGGSISPASRTVNHGSTTTFTVTPNAGYTAMMGGTCGGTPASRTAQFTYTTNAVTANCTVSASFAANTYSLTVTKAGTGTGRVTSSPAGINCGSDCSEAYNSGTVVTLTATADPSSTFAGWSGGCTGGACAVTMNAAKSVTATFNTGINDITGLPKTGQTISYATNDDGHTKAGLEWPDPRFTNNGDGTVTDNLTGLMWLMDGGCIGNDWYALSTMIADFNSAPGRYDCRGYKGNYSDWRLPNVKELESLINYGVSSSANALNSAGFKNVTPNFCWSSTTFESVAGNSAWLVSMADGMKIPCSKYGSFYTLPVRAGTSDKLYELPKTGQTVSYAYSDDGDIRAGTEWPTPRFTDNGDGTVKDNLTGLTWLKDGGCLRKNWNYALQAIEDINTNPGHYNCLDYTGNYSDWRLPNVKELESLINYGDSNSTNWLSSAGFKNIKPNFYWSSTTFPGNNQGWAMDMAKGYLINVSKSNSFDVWPVRGGNVIGKQ